jgi:hypothetical protein
VLLTIIRSYDLERLWHHPELEFAMGLDFVRHHVRRFGGHPDVPVHVLWADPPRSAVAMYAMHYEGRFIAGPIGTTAAAPPDVIGGPRSPMTLFFVIDEDVPEDGDVEAMAAADMLFHAIENAVGAQDEGVTQP